MKREEIVHAIAPCGLNCARCLNNQNSPIAAHAKALREELGAFGKHAHLFATMDPAFSEYEAFARVLVRLTSGNCESCRTGACILGTCGIQACAAKRGIDFCFECCDFPCEPENTPELVKKRWLHNNNRMKTIGIEQYCAASFKEPRY
ncbi:DUF3795 domain-containing protein [Desulfovibrio inopinatus]|uniref:DUF3795 domain-containing protein n=1 Tax=Desulfovibrio inopinatus TaxID=102109 RepID=UPI00042A149C|nr:DUF3795 domain-containing protein [Desulfovibrio inopinatus]